MSEIEQAYAEAEHLIESVYESFEGDSHLEDYHDRHSIQSMLILTVSNYYAALAEVQKLLPAIQGKVVIEIGAGVGMLAIQMARYAKHVYAIEVDPSWNEVFTRCLYAVKPANLTWIFGRAQDMIGILHGDIAVVYTRSDVKGMGAIAAQLAPELIRGPLVEHSERYLQGMTEEQFKYAEELATAAMLSCEIGRRGLLGSEIKEIERKFSERFPERA